MSAPERRIEMNQNINLDRDEIIWVRTHHVESLNAQIFHARGILGAMEAGQISESSGYRILENLLYEASAVVERMQPEF